MKINSGRRTRIDLYADIIKTIESAPSGPMQKTALMEAANVNPRDRNRIMEEMRAKELIQEVYRRSSGKEIHYITTKKGRIFLRAYELMKEYLT